MFKKILIANRGEIAVRIMRACREMGIKTVSVYSKADVNSLHRVYADESYCIGDPDPKKSYLNIDLILQIAKNCNAEAIHPGYGFLAENAEFAKRCEEEGIVFIGPKSKVIEAMGSKINARKIMKDIGVPVLPGSNEIKDIDDAIKWANKIGYPIVIKASGGGGGIGINIVWNEDQLENAFYSAKRLSEKYFKDSSIYIEKYLPKPRHIEFQILADNYGNVVHLGERECSIQRRYQKLIEESPSPAINEELREKFGKIAVKGAKGIGYTNAGTVEFLYQDGEIYFLEMNTRLQVEHTVTEMVTGIDIVKEQIKIAYGECLEFGQEDISIRGHAIECRIYAEDPINFYPVSGKIKFYRSPGGIGIRIDSGVHMGCELPPYYDPLISKLVAWGRNRMEAINRMERALYEYIIEGVETNIPFHVAVMRNEEFRKGNTHTRFVEEQKIVEKVKEIIKELRPIKHRLREIFVVEGTITPVQYSMWKVFSRFSSAR